MAVDETRQIHIRLPAPLVRQVDLLSAAWEVDRRGAIERLLEAAIPRTMRGLDDQVREVASAI